MFSVTAAGAETVSSVHCSGGSGSVISSAEKRFSCLSQSQSVFAVCAPSQKQLADTEFDWLKRFSAVLAVCFG